MDMDPVEARTKKADGHAAATKRGLGSANDPVPSATGATSRSMGFPASGRNDALAASVHKHKKTHRRHSSCRAVVSQDMATQQDEGGVPFSIAHQQQHFRLLELPAEVAELIDAPNPPLLCIKSQAQSAASGTSNAKPAYAVLCTPSKTFQLRQVQTSNSLFVAQPALEAHGNEIPNPTTRAIALCTATLEAHASTASAVALLRETLPIYDIVAGEVDATSNGRSKASIFSNLPLSDGECQAAWDGLMAFEADGGSHQPSPNALSQVWRCINAAALAEGIKVDAQFLTNDMTKAAAEEGHPPGLIEAVLAYLSTDDSNKTGPWSCLDRAKTVAFTGRTLLEAKRSADFLIADFTDTWEDRLPEVWRKDAQLSAIQGLYDLPSATTIKAKSKVATLSSVDSSVAAMKPSARKWHEKLAKTRNM